MKVWDEDDVVHELALARANAEQGMPFVLVLVHKWSHQRDNYDFCYYAADTYDRIDELFRATSVVLADGTLVDGSSEDDTVEPLVWIAQAASSSSDDDDTDDGRETPSKPTARQPPLESYCVGKAIFHTASGEPLLKMEGSEGWREAMKQKYHLLEVQSRKYNQTYNT